jgi:hypothetical protein
MPAPASEPVAAPTSAPAPPAAAPAPTAVAANGAPSFTHPTEITNPLYPVSLAGQTIALGQEGGKPSRNEVTLLPDTKSIAWNGQQIEARIAQFVAYTDGKLVEVAYDYFAQADDGSVYYLGEDVSNYANGKIASHEGSWLAGKDGAPPALIMPAHPALGQVFKPENLPGVVYEVDEVLSLSQKTITPSGPTNQGVLVKETLMDGSIEHKVYAANFGIIEDSADDEQLNLVLFNPTGARPGTVPEQLAALEAAAEEIFDVSAGGSAGQVAAQMPALTTAWQSYQASGPAAPQPFVDALGAALDELQKRAAAKNPAAVAQAANNLSAALADLYAVYRPASPADLGRLDMLERQVLLDLTARQGDAAADSLAKIGAVWARLKPVVLAHNGAAAAAQFDAGLASQQSALAAGDSAAVRKATEAGLELVDTMEKLF